MRLESIEDLEVLLKSDLGRHADRPQAAAERLESGRVVLGRHLRAVEQCHVAELHTPAIDAFVSLQPGDDVANADFQFEIVVADETDARRRQAICLPETVRSGRCGKFVVRRRDLAHKGVDDRRCI